MDPFTFPPLAALLNAASVALSGLTDLLSPAVGTAAGALAVVLVTLLVRAALIPAGVSQARSEQARARLAPRLRELRRRHGKDPERLQRETLDLYRAEHVSPFAGMLPTLAQAPVLGLLYAIFVRSEIAGRANPMLVHDLFGAPLGTSLVQLLVTGGGSATAFLLYGALLTMLAVIAELSRRLLQPVQDGSTVSPGMRLLTGALHHLTAVFALFVPLAAALYLTVSAAWTLGQRLLLRRRYPFDAAA